MFWHLVLTDECNLCCSYCRAKAFEPGAEPSLPFEYDPEVPVELAVDPAELAAFLARDPEPTLTFYGGEPLLRADLIEEIMDLVPGCRFMLQTNGLLLDRLSPHVLQRFHTVLVSIDGPEALTDQHRGQGVYARVVANVGRLIDAGFNGELIARMTVDEATEIVEAVLHCDALPFSGIHWQLDANFWGDYDRRDFSGWVEGSYNPGIRRLLEIWVERIEAGRVPRWYPFLDTTWDLLAGRSSLLRCGSGHANYTIQTDGRIVPCPIMTGMSDHYLGHIRDTDPLRLPHVMVPGDCPGCEIVNFCGGRCLYSAVTQPWPPEHRALVCGTVRNLHDALVQVLPRVQASLDDGTVLLEDFAHVKYNGCEIIP
ncbi:MAG TPA: TIGR04084 family radical SAM/SPASM domain-containing protein [Methanoregulaceae archaeon]|nr:TIGR04084 family radical SAM/SPASM domain-containing protein [Methanoregulaceae archaeon]HQJ86923.1 TIGR04084 family radical SAM/SPASM domain-containing protein [Methanoregulaceae archaeon]